MQGDRVYLASCDEGSGAQSILSFDRETGRPRYRQDILEHKVGDWVDGCPSSEGGHNWQATSFHRPSRQLIIPLSQSCIAIRAQTVEQRPGGGSAGGADRRPADGPGFYFGCSFACLLISQKSVP